MSSSPSLTRASSFLFLVSGFWILASLPAPAIVDTNNNTLSDIWEKQYNNGNLLTNLNPQADPDSDGWTNMQEAAAGTNPFNPNPPNGFIRPNIVHIPATYIPGTNGNPVIFTPEAITLTWPTLAGKQYTLHYSPDLSEGSWQPVEAPYIGNGNNTQYGIPLTQENGSIPDKLFWRVAVGDIDSDGDTLSNYEESILGTNSNNIDTDFDGIADNLDPFPLVSATLADPDGTNPPAGSTTDLLGFWDFESQQVVGSAINFPDRSGNNRHATSSGPGPQLLGMPSKAARIGAGYITIPTATVQGQSTYTISGWFKLAKDSIKTSNGVPRMIYALYDQVGIGPPPQYVQASQGSILYLRNTVAGEQWFIGGYRQYPYYNQYPNINGNLASEFSGHYFIRPSGTTDDGQWHHFAATRSTTSNGQKLYLDGKLVIQGALIEYPVAYDSDTTLTLGALYPGYTPSNFPDALIDRLRVHSKLLTDAEITALCRQDVDRDGLWDITETSTRYSDYSSSVIIHPDPTNPNPPQPTQTGYARSPFLHSSAVLDFDQDELNDLAEQTAGTSLTKPDTDDDNLSDGFEISNNFNPLNAYSSGPTGPRDDLSDPDSDTLTTFTEYLNSSNPRNANSDGDGKSDAQEIAQGSDPGNAADSGNAPTDPPEPVPFRINGDYTAWEATLKGKGPNDTRTRRLRMTSHNVAADQVLPLLRGNAYELSLRYIRTRPGEKVPWYCWEASIAGKNAPSFTIADHWIVDNSSAVLAPHTHSHGTNRVVNKKVNIIPVEVTIRKKGESVPENGVLAKTGDVLEFALSPALFDTEKLLESKIYWLHRELQANATYGPWTYFGVNGRGTKFEQSMALGGIYQIKAEFIDGSAEYLYTRKKDEKTGGFAYGPGKKGDPDRIGICDKQIQINICREAQTFYGSEVYSMQFVLPAQYGFPEYPNSGNSIIRCNIFVAHRATAAGAFVPKINGFFNEYPPLANEWAGIEDTSIFPGNPNYIQSWPILPIAENPQPGWVIAHPNPSDAGHCAIIDYDGEGIGAGISGTVNKDYNEFWDGSSRYRNHNP